MEDMYIYIDFCGSLLALWLLVIIKGITRFLGVLRVAGKGDREGEGREETEGDGLVGTRGDHVVQLDASPFFLIITFKLLS